MALPRIKTMDDFTKIINENKVVIIEIYATWCNPCRTVAPLFYELAYENKDIFAAKCNCDEAEEVVRHLQIQSIPVFKKFENGKEVGMVYGIEKEEIRSLFTNKGK